MGAGVVDNQDITAFNGGQAAVDGEFVVVFAEAAHDVVGSVGFEVVFAHNGDVVVGAVHAGTHEIGHGGVESDVFFVGVFFVDGFGNQEAVGSGNDAAAFEGEGGGLEAGIEDVFGVEGFDSPGNGAEVNGRVIRAVGDADAAAEVHEVDGNPGASGDFGEEGEEHVGGFDEVGGVEFVGGHHGVDAEVLNAFLSGDAVGFDHLRAGESVLGFFGFADDVVAGFLGSGVESEGEGVGEADFFEIVEVGDVVEVDEGADVFGFSIFFQGCVVGGEEGALAGDAECFGEDEFGEGGAVGAHSFFGEDLNDPGVGAGFHGVVVAEAGGGPLEGGGEIPGGSAYAFLVVDVEGGGVVGGDVPKGGFGEGEGFAGQFK